MIYFVLYQIPLLVRLIILSILLILSKKLVQISAVSSTKMFGAVVNSRFNFVSFVVNLPKSAKSGWLKLVKIRCPSPALSDQRESKWWLKKANSIAKRSHSLTLKNLTLNTMNAMRSITKTKPKRTQTNPIFQGSNLNLSEITRIVTDFRQHFLCKTKPNSVVGIQIPVEYDMSEKVNYATCPAPTLRLFHKVGAVETKPIFSKIQIENKGLTTVSLVQHLQGKCCGKVGTQLIKN